MRDRQMVFVLGLQGVGKSRYIDDHYPEAAKVDIEYWWDNLPESMDNYEGATYTKLLALYQLLARIEHGRKLIAVEMTGLSKPNQAAIRAMMQVAFWKGYDVEIVYLKPRDWNAYVEVIDGDEGAISMFREYSRAPKNNGGKWREPDRCPFFDEVKVVEVDHASWGREDRWETLEIRAAISAGK
jgi:hypothetical protein